MKIIQKTLKSLLKSLDAKVAAIEEAWDISTMRLDELMGSLHAFKMNLKHNKRDNSMALKVEAKKVVKEQNWNMENKMRMMTLYYILKTFIRSTRNLGMVTVILGEKLSSSIRYLRKCIRMIKIWGKKTY